MHLMSPRCNDKGNIKRVSIQQIRCFFPVFTLSLLHENSLYHFRKHLPGTRHSRYLSAVVAHDSFLLLTAALYFKGSPRLYNWLLNHRHFGPYIRNFRENKAIPLRAKVISLVLMWGTMLYCIFFLIPLLWVKILLGLIAAGVTYHILSFKTLR